jgi:hypothetical protein
MNYLSYNRWEIPAIASYIIGTLLVWEWLFIGFSWITVPFVLLTFISAIYLTAYARLPLNGDIDTGAWFMFVLVIITTVLSMIGLVPGVIFGLWFGQAIWLQYQYGKNQSTVALFKLNYKRTLNTRYVYVFELLYGVIMQIIVFLIATFVPLVAGHWFIFWLISVPFGYTALRYSVIDTYSYWTKHEVWLRIKE